MDVDQQGEKLLFGIGMPDMRQDFTFLAKRYGLGSKVWKLTT